VAEDPRQLAGGIRQKEQTDAYRRGKRPVGRVFTNINERPNSADRSSMTTISPEDIEEKISRTGGG
jgi:hypothetical protein